MKALRIYEVVFEKYKGETIVVLAYNFDGAVTVARAWSKRKKYGQEIVSVSVYGEVDAQ
jgi:hypothetical protein